MADLTRKTANLFDYNSIQVGTAWNNSSNANRAVNYVRVTPNTQYSFKINILDVDLVFIAELNAIGDSTALGAYELRNTNSLTFITNTNTNILAVQFNKSNITLSDCVNCKAMLNTGSTALPYEPYGWLHSLRKLGTATDTITTLPADLYADGTNATVGLKGNMSRTGTPTPSSPIQPSECGERAANLFDYNAYFNSTFVPYNEFFEYATIQLLPNTTYTLSTSIAEYEYTTRETPFIVTTTNQVPTTAGGGISNISPITITTENDGILKLYKRISGRAIQPTKGLFDNGAWLMLNTGSTALPYEPYGYKIPILSANTTTTVYLGEVESTRQIKKLTITGNEGWKTASSDNTKHYLDVISPDYLRADNQITYMSSHYNAFGQTTSATSVPNNSMAMSSAASQRLYIADANYTTDKSFIQYLTQQYANGTPVTVWYVLAAPTTGIVNEPLRKIGEYVDTVGGITIPTIAGADSFDVLTTLKPSEVELTYTGWHDATVKEWDGSQWS